MRTGTRRERARASQVVEAAVTMPLLLALLLLTVGGSQLFRASLTVNAAAAEGARYYSLSAKDAEGTDADAIAEHVKESIGDAALEVECSHGADESGESYTMRHTDRDGATRTATVHDESTSMTVTVSKTIKVPGLGERTVTASHTGSATTEGIK